MPRGHIAAQRFISLFRYLYVATDFYFSLPRAVAGIANQRSLSDVNRHQRACAVYAVAFFFPVFYRIE